MEARHREGAPKSAHRAAVGHAIIIDPEQRRREEMKWNKTNNIKRKYEEPDMTINAGTPGNNQRKRIKQSILNGWDRQREEILDGGQGKHIKYTYSEKRMTEKEAGSDGQQTPRKLARKVASTVGKAMRQVEFVQGQSAGGGRAVATPIRVQTRREAKTPAGIANAPGCKRGDRPLAGLSNAPGCREGTPGDLSNASGGPASLAGMANAPG